MHLSLSSHSQESSW